MSAVNITDPNETYTISQFIALKDMDSVTYSKYAVFEQSLTEPDMVYAIDNIIYTYMDELKALKKCVVVSSEEKMKYAYKPKLLAFDLYGSVETYFVILALNGMCNLKEFTLEQNRFYALTPSDMVNIMNSIYNADRDYLSKNRNNLGISQS